MTLLRELIDIPERVHKGDFVLKLNEGVLDPVRTLANYVVTQQLVGAFDQALGLVKSALEGRQSKAAFLHGSFGSGKSHFMAVLHLLMGQHTAARSHPDLAPVVSKHRWLEGKKFLLVPFHMIGAKTVESAIFGRYVSFVGALHPHAPVPAVFLGETLLEQAESWRKKLGDVEFLGHLGQEAGGWGKLGAWTRERYDSACAARPNDQERLSLISAIVTHLLPAYGKVLGADGGESYVSLDDGLTILTQHAKDLGYDGLIFFLDEVILWLASKIADPGFVNDQGARLAKLVEGQGAPRAIPLVSFLARQRDLRELVGEHMPGAEQLGVFDVLKWWGGRFDTIRLDDRNLPTIVERRLLKPRSEQARRELDAAFAETKKVRRETYETLLTQGFGEDDFRRVYPFSPALIQTLVAVSSVLQRERTAIKALMQLLVDQRDTLQVGQLVPVGDLYDVIAEGDEPFSDAMRSHFENAKKLYTQKLRPRLLQQHGLTLEQCEALPAEDKKKQAFRGDDRLIKTLLLASMAPEVESLKNMTARRLVALNHGTMRVPIPGEEANLALSRLRGWAGDVGEIRLEGDRANPTIALEIGTVDTASIVQRAAQSVDTAGARRVKIKEILYREFGIESQDGLYGDEHPLVWRGTRRTLQVIYGNVRELSSDSLKAKGSDWRLCIDYPFDAPGFTPDDDIRHVEEFRKSSGSTRTVCWIPAFLSKAREDDLGTLVALDYVLQSDQRFHDAAQHLAPADRGQAKTMLQSMQSALRQRVTRALEAAYGIANEEPGMLGEGLEVAERFQCLEATRPTLARPVAADLRRALDQLFDQMLALQYPKHPQFGVEIKGAVLKRVFEWVSRAARDPNFRVVVDKERRREVRDVVEPLGLGTMGEDALVLSEYWRSHFDRQAALGRGQAITVARMREWTDRPEPRGLPDAVQDLLILAYAELTSRTFFLHGGHFKASLERRLDDELELREQPLPSDAHWQAARDRAQRMFGVEVGSLLGAANVGDLIDKVGGVTRQCLPACLQLEKDLRTRLEALGLRAQDTQRWRTASGVVSLCQALEQGGTEVFVERLGTATAPTAWDAMGTSCKQAEAVDGILRHTRWDALETAWQLAGAWREEAQKLRQRTVDALSHDELAEPLAEALRRVETDANALVRRALTPTPEPPNPAPVAAPGPAPVATPLTPPAVTPGRRTVDQGTREGLKAAELRRLLAELESKLGSGRRWIKLQWQIEEDSP